MADPPPAPAGGGEDEIVDGQTEEPPGPGEEKLYVAVPLTRTAWQWRGNLQWAAARARRSDPPRRLVLVYIHRVSMTINMMGAALHVSQVQESVVAQHRREETERINKLLDEYLFICRGLKVAAEKLVIEKSDVVRGIVDLVAQDGVRELAMGAADDRRSSKSMKAPRSKKAIAVRQKADPACRIFFLCKGNLVYTREPSEVRLAGESPEGSTGASSSSSGSSPRTSIALPLRSKSLGEGEAAGEEQQPEPLPARSKSLNLGSRPSPLRRSSADEETVQAPEMPRRSLRVEGLLDDVDAAVADDDPGVPLPALPENAEAEDEGCRDLQDKLNSAIMEADSLKRVAYEESRRRQKAERDLAEVTAKAREAESTLMKAAKSRKEAEERVAGKEAEIERDKQQLHHIADQISSATARGAALQEQIKSSELMAAALEGKLSDAYGVLDALRQERRVSSKRKEMPFRAGVDGFSRFTLPELSAATCDFDEGAKIGASDSGEVYRGILHQREVAVAIKVLKPELVAGDIDFCGEVEALCDCKHRNLVMVIGACEAARAVVTELVPGGSLEERLIGKDGERPALSWQARASIAMEISSALAFLHSRSPEPLVHGALKPSNVLLDSDGSCKLADFGLCRLLVRRGRSSLAFMDPEVLATGIATPQADVYAFGVVLLMLLTGKPAFRAKKAAQAALERGALGEALDGSAGEWPQEHAEEMAALGLQCCDLRSKNRPADFAGEARRVLQPAVSAAAAARRGPSSWSFDSNADGSCGVVPSYFMCPILKEVMRDPQTAADGFTYEAAAIKEWLAGGHDTSPMTNLKLASADLLPNHALRRAIDDWALQHRAADPSRQLDQLVNQGKRKENIRM